MEQRGPSDELCGQYNVVRMGDVNDILDANEKQGGLFHSERSLRDFRSFVASTHLLDLGYVGVPSLGVTGGRRGPFVNA